MAVHQVYVCTLVLKLVGLFGMLNVVMELPIFMTTAVTNKEIVDFHVAISLMSS